MELIDQIKKYAGNLPAEIKENRGIYELEQVVAERKPLLSLTTDKLEYHAKFRIDSSQKVLSFTEMLEESAGVKLGLRYNNLASLGLGRKRTIVEQSTLFGKKYDYKFDSKKIRSKFEEMAKSAGYEFKYQLTAKGL